MKLIQPLPQVVGYDKLVCDAKVTVLTTEEEIIRALTKTREEPSLQSRRRFMRPWADNRVIKGVIVCGDAGI